MSSRSFPFGIDLPDFEPGWVWLAGAGPGDPALLSVLALHALREADVVVYDALVDERTLALVRKGAALEYAGKRGGAPSFKQADISLRLIALAQKGKRVLRLKGGDPFVFGRGGEEALALVAAQIPFRVIPGISAAIGGLAYAGIPLTHRGANSAVTFLTGFDSTGALPSDLDWDALAKGSPFLVIYMALSRLDEIAARLIAAGRSKDEPAAIVSQATLPGQTVWESTLGGIAEVAAAQGVAPPAMLAVGPNVRLRDGLDWLGAIAGKALNAEPFLR